MSITVEEIETKFQTLAKEYKDITIQVENVPNWNCIRIKVFHKDYKHNYAISSNLYEFNYFINNIESILGQTKFNMQDFINSIIVDDCFCENCGKQIFINDYSRIVPNIKTGCYKITKETSCILCKECSKIPFKHVEQIGNTVCIKRSDSSEEEESEYDFYATFPNLKSSFNKAKIILIAREFPNEEKTNTN